MTIINKLDELTSIKEITNDDKIKVWETIQYFSKYIDLVIRKNTKLALNKTVDEIENEEIEEKYNECIEKINFLNNISQEFMGEKIFEEFERKKIEEFFWEVTNEVYKNRLR